MVRQEHDQVPPRQRTQPAAVQEEHPLSLQGSGAQAGSAARRLSGTPLIAVTQGDPAGVGPEVVLRAVFETGLDCAFALAIERAVVAFWRRRQPDWPWSRLRWVDSLGAAADDCVAGSIVACDPLGQDRPLRPGEPDSAGAKAALAAIDLAANWTETGLTDALVTAPVSKAAIATIKPGFRGHTDSLARRAGLERYGRDYLMAFLAEDLNVALHSVHLPLREALGRVTADSIVAGLQCLAKHQPRLRIGVAGLNPHAGEGGLLGSEDADVVAPAVGQARAGGVDASGPWSPDTVFARARRGEFDWVYALYHDQGLIAVKTLDFGAAVNWTLGLPYVRTSVDHGTAFDLAGRGEADHRPMLKAIETAVHLLRST